MRLSTFFMAGLLLAGCHSNQSYYDPFLGRTTVPPPGTIQTGPPGTQPLYYQGAAPPVGAAPMPTGVPAPTGAPVMAPATPPPGTPPPPGAYGGLQSSVPPAKAMQTGQNEYIAGTAAIARRSPVVTAPAGQSPVALASGQSAPGPTAVTSQAWLPSAAPTTTATAAPAVAQPSPVIAPEQAVTIPNQ